MVASGDVQIAQDGGLSNTKLHPYFMALIRWCVSSVWSTATLVLHRFMTTPLPPSTAQKPPKPRPASSDHLHPEPRVDCVVLHTPAEPTIDFIFVHGLYGSLSNTWRQGEWRPKYNSEPTKEPLRRASVTSNDNTIENTRLQDENVKPNDANKDVSSYGNRIEFDNIFKSNEATFERDEMKFYDDIRKILPKDNAFITEKFYNNTLLDQVEIIGNYETQANFVKDLFERQEGCETRINDEKTVCDCNARSAKCETGCGCLCDECYSPCWPRDWIRTDYPEARIISINYTSDPYLWRPLWIKESKRQRLHERAEQMIFQLLGLGVGERPIIWVGHSKGGLFIKQIYCEAYEAYQKLHKTDDTKVLNGTTEQRDQFISSEYNNDNIINHNLENIDTATHVNTNFDNNEEDSTPINHKFNDDMDSECVYIENSIKEAFHFYDTESDDKSNLNDKVNVYCKRKIFKDVYTERRDKRKEEIVNNIGDDGGAFKSDNEENEESPNDLIYNFQTAEDLDEIQSSNNAVSSRHLKSSMLLPEDLTSLRRRAGLWSNSAGFMFYSVPHRGSPLADIKTPITARSIELMEICKDCNLVLSLQERWLAATATSRPVVRSLVETCRTLMSVLWLRIVSVDSADPGIGTLSGVNVDHREICKPSSRSCLLYKELMRLVTSSLAEFHVRQIK